MAVRLLADVLWEAANANLWSGAGGKQRGNLYSCYAVEDSLAPFSSKKAKALLYGLGMTYDAGEVWGYKWTPKERQGVRYMWLLLAMHVAEDEGITV